MCGIAGIYNYKTDRPVAETVLHDMANMMIHRGPDDKGYYTQGPIGLAHRRLSIIDPKSGHQPMHDGLGNTIVFNGEVYNFIELRKQLSGPFKTNCDTEVILHAMNQQGIACLQKFNGMFAIAFWNNDELILARDRLGIKPLYYAITEDGIIFASEIKAILATGQVKAERNDLALPAYFSTGFVPGEETLFKGIKKLPPGTFMRVNENGITIKPYWELNYTEQPISETEAKEKFTELLHNAIQLRLRSDVPLGVFLSGGLDSSAIVAMLAPELSRPLETFSVYYQMNGFDETAYARQVAERYNTTHREIEVTPESFFDFIPNFIWHMDEPVTEAAAISLYYVSKLAKESVTVTLSGEGADEILAGYEVYGYMNTLDHYRKLPQAVRTPLGYFWKNAPHPKIRKYGHLADQPLEERYLGVSLFTPNILHDANGSLLNKDMLEHLKQQPTYAQWVSPIYEKSKGAPPLNRMLDLDMKTWLPDDILIKADRMSMATSTELRVPFLDHKLVEFCATLPTHFKRRGKNVKYLLRSIMQDKLPKPILARKKMGFPTPLVHLFRGKLYDYTREVISDPSTQQHGIFDTQHVLSLLEEHKAGRDHHKRLWQILVLEMWQRRFLSNSSRI